MKNSIPIWVIILLAWIVGGSLFYRSLCCGLAGSGFTIADGNTTVAKSTQNVIFGFGSAAPEFPDPTQNALRKTVAYLAKNRGKALVITGSFLDNENQPNLGVARGESLQEYLQELGLSQDFIIIEDQLSNDLPVDDNKVYNSLSYAILDIPGFSLSIKEDEEVIASADDNITFKHSAYTYNIPLSESLENALSKIGEYLKKSPDKVLTITGWFSDAEENTSILPDLGLARANQIKNILQDLGVASEQIKTDSEKRNNLIFPGNNLYGGASYSFSASPEAYDHTEEIAEIEEELKIESIQLYFETDESTLDLSSQQREYFAKLIDYLDEKPSARVNVVGHTDNKGRRAYNLELSRERAVFIKQYLVKNGLNANQVAATGEGESEPITDNDTEEGRAKNRRVEVFIQ